MTEERGETTRVADLAVSIIRTWVPMGVGGALTAIAAREGWALDPSTSASIGAVAGTACAGLYYLAARLLETSKGSSRFKRSCRTLGTWMLGGVLRRPVYVPQEQYDKLTHLGDRPQKADPPNGS